MKNLFFLSAVAFFAFLSCRNDELGLQKIDQIIQLYIDSAGQDMLNNNIIGGYTNIRMNDVNGLTDTAPVTFGSKKNADTVSYIEYVAGARRIRIDSSANSKTYESKIALLMTKKVSSTKSVIINDTMRIQYHWTPDLFQVSKIWYNNQLKFTKVGDELNIVKVSK